MPECSKLLSDLFADDTTLQASSSNLNELVEFTNVEFKKVVSFFQQHKLSLHPKKTTFMVFSNIRNLNFNDIQINVNFNKSGCFDQNLIFPVSCVNLCDTPYVKFLGIYIDSKLSFKYHIEFLSKKLSKGLYLMRTAKNFLTLKALKSLYYALFHSHLIYGIQLWSCTSDSNLKTIFIKQKSAIRILNNASYNSHTEPLFKNSQILPLHLLIEFFKLQFMQQFSQGFLPQVFNDTWTTNATRRQDQDHIELRSNNNIFIPFARLESTKLLPLTSFPKIWAAFPDENIKFLRTKTEFNFELKKFFIQSLSPIVHCNRLLCPSCHLHTVT